jgi:transcriptional regulator with XRE-family HTH domain
MDNRSPARLLTADEWQQKLGADMRELRLRQNLTQAEVARRANIDRTTVVRIEAGEGGSIGSLIQIARALGREQWLGSFMVAEPGVSPMQELRERQHQEANKRQRASQPRPPE